MTDLKKEPKVAWSKTNEALTVVFNGKVYVFSTSDHSYSAALEAVKTYNWDKMLELTSKAAQVKRYCNGDFVVKTDENLYLRKEGGEENEFEDEPVHDVIARRLIQFMDEGLPHQPLMNFWRNLRQNPSNDSRSQLFMFLEVNRHPLTEDGYFYGYKKVVEQDGKLVDGRTGKMDNSPGRIVEMPREEVDPNRFQTCSVGLHVAAYEYAHDYSGSQMILVKVNPRDVVAVPNDYNNQKMRVCRYEVVSLCNEEDTRTLARNSVPQDESTVDEEDVQVSAFDEGYQNAKEQTPAAHGNYEDLNYMYGYAKGTAENDEADLTSVNKARYDKGAEHGYDGDEPDDNQTHSYYIGYADGTEKRNAETDAEEEEERRREEEEETERLCEKEAEQKASDDYDDGYEAASNKNPAQNDRSADYYQGFADAADPSGDQTELESKRAWIEGYEHGSKNMNVAPSVNIDSYYYGYAKGIEEFHTKAIENMGVEVEGTAHPLPATQDETLSSSEGSISPADNMERF